MKTIGFILIFSTLSFYIYSQELSNCDNESDSGYSLGLQDGLIAYRYINEYPGILGKRYFGTPGAGELYLKEGEVIRQINLSYDQFLGELIWFRYGDSEAGVISRDMIKGFKLSKIPDHAPTESFEKMVISIPQFKHEIEYVQILVHSCPRLCVYRKSSLGGQQNKEFEERLYYFLEDNGREYQVNLKRRSLLSVPVIDRELMKKIQREYKMSIRNNEQGLITAIELYNARKMKLQEK